MRSLPATEVHVRLRFVTPKSSPGFWGHLLNRCQHGPEGWLLTREKFPCCCCCSIYQHCCWSPWRPGLSQLQAVALCYRSDIMPGVAKETSQGTWIGLWRGHPRPYVMLGVKRQAVSAHDALKLLPRREQG